MGGETVPSTNYVYNKLTGAFSLNVPVTGNVAVDATCVKTWDVTVPTGDGYTATPSGVTIVDDGLSFTFTLSAAQGYRIDPDNVGITGDGVMSYTGPDAGVYTYTITGITSDITIVIDLDNGLIKTWDITLSDGDGYELDPVGGKYTIDDAGSFTFTVKVLSGYMAPDGLVTIQPGSGSGTLSGPVVRGNVHEFTISNIKGDIEVSVDPVKLYTVNVTYNAGAAFEYSWDGWETAYTPELDPEGGVYTFEVPEGSVLLVRATSYNKYDVTWEDDVSTTVHKGPEFTGPATREGSDVVELNIVLTFTPIAEGGTMSLLIIAAIMIAALILWMAWVGKKEGEKGPGR
jgi:hypothetical protein